jgi:tetratricopeptide (TPR) repeat protein
MLQLGLERLLAAAGPSEPELGDPPRDLVLDEALLRFERARRDIPDDPDLAYYTAVALSSYRAASEHDEPRADEAFHAWQRVRELDPSYLPDRVAFGLAALHMRRQELAEARAEYEAALAHAVPPTVDLLDRTFASSPPFATPSERYLAALHGPLDAALIEGNLAEAAMLLGDLPAAVAHYRGAAASTGSPFARVLALWGLALALDRAGSHAEALRTATRALREDPVQADPYFAAALAAHGRFAILHLDGVFFEPRCEIHAYEALGHEALARADEGPAQSVELGRALRSWRLFLAEGGTASRFAPIARAHVARLEPELAPATAPSGRAPRR